MRSMTGFGHASFQSHHLELDVNLRSVNGRFFEMRLHMPKEYLFLESKMKKIVSQKISRGTLDLYIHRRAFFPGHQELKIEGDMAMRWLKSLRKLGRETGLNLDVSLLQLAQLPGVATTLESYQVSPLEQKKLLQTVSEAAQVCIDERAREGAALQKELDQLLLKLVKIRQKMHKLRGLANEELTLKYRERLKKWSHFDENRLAQEIAALIDKADINEELSRLEEHFKGCQRLLRTGQPVGKKLDFYSQEILREFNTVGSKSQIAKLTELVVEAKSIVEKFREQVQNVE